MPLPEGLKKKLRRNGRVGSASRPPVPSHSQRVPDPWPLTRPLISFSEHDHDMTNVMVVGAEGSGKTSAVSRKVKK